MSDGVGSKFTFRPHQRRAPGDAKGKPPRDADAPEAPHASEVLRDVFTMTHQAGEDAEQVRFREQEAVAERAKKERVHLQGGELSVSGQKFDIGAKRAGEMTLLGPNTQVITAIEDAITAKKPLLLSASPGSGAAFTARWLMAATKRKSEMVRLARSTTLESLVGALRPDAKKDLRVQDGPLTRIIRGGGVMVMDGVDRADPQVRAALKALANGLKAFPHPVSGELIPVHEDFRLVLIGDQRERQLARQYGVKSVREVRGYSEQEHARLCTEKLGLPHELSATLARFHEKLSEAVRDSDLDFGRGFPLGWEMLERAGRRLAKKRGEPNAGEVARALLGVYGARLSRTTHQETFEKLLQELELWPPAEAKVAKSADETFLQTPRVDRALNLVEDALAANELVLLRAAGQSGATRLVEELGQRRKQQVVTVVGHSGVDAQALVETPSFDEGGRLYFRPGRITKAMLEGELLFVDHLDHLPREQQNAIFQLQRMQTIRVLEGGKIVEKPVHANARIVLSTTAGNVRGRTPPEPRDRATATEIHLPPPSIEELGQLLPAAIRENEGLAETLIHTASALQDEQASGDLRRLGRFLDFANAAKLLVDQGFDVNSAVARSARLVYSPKKSDTLKALEKGKARGGPEGPLWQALLGLSAKEADAALAKTGFRITDSMHAHLDALAIAKRLGRPVRTIGPASSGKTVLGSIFAALLDKAAVRVNFSLATEGRDLVGGMGPVNEKGRTVFRHVEGPAMRAAELQSVLIADEWNLSRQGQMALKSALDYRGRLIDPENDLERSFAQSFFYAAQNPNDAALGRFEPPPEIADCMFTIIMGARPVEEKIEVVLSQCELKREHVEPIANFFGDLEMLISQDRLRSSVAPVTSTERDLLKAARAAQHLLTRDKVRDPDEARKLVGREAFRIVRDQLADPKEREMVFDLVRRHFGDDVTPPARPNGIERVKVKVGGEPVEMIQIGAARFPVRVLDDPELQKLVPKPDGLRDPVGVQFEFLESVLLGAELGEPVAVVGNTGTGKTMLMKWLAKQLNQPIIEQPFHADMSEEHLFGAQVVKRDGTVAFQYGDLPECIKRGIWYIGDEPTTLRHSVRESLNPVTERSEIQIAQKRPPERIAAKDWAADFRYFETANGDDIRKEGYSAPEASRRRIVALPELRGLDEYLEVGRRDFAGARVELEWLPKKQESREEVVKALLGWVDGRSAFGRALAAATSYALTGEGDAPEVAELEAPALELSAAQVATLCQAYHLFDRAKRDSALRPLIDGLLAASKGDALAAAIQHLDPEGLSPAAAERIQTTAVVNGRLARPEEVDRATKLFAALRDLQSASKDESLTPLTPRIYSTFLEVLTELRSRRSFPAAATRAAELILAPKLPRSLQSKLTDLLLEHVGEIDRGGAATAPEQLPNGARFGDLYVPFGNGRPWKPSNERFPLTEPRCKNLRAIADAMELGRGRPVSITDDENGEAMETLREYGRLTGHPVTEISLPPNVEIEQLLERLVVSKEAAGGFEPELQQIAQAVREGHVLVLRGCGNVSSTRLERLNSLGDGRQAIRLPVSGEWLKAPPEFRMVMMRTPDSLEKYSAALENRLVAPPLTTQDVPTTEAAREARAAELAAVLRERCGLSKDAADKLGVFHVYLNHMLREGRFASGRGVGTFLNPDAESVGRRLGWLLERHEVDDENEALLELVMSVYGQRLATPADREKLLKLAQDAFGTESVGVELGAEITPGPQLNRVGPWALARDPRGTKESLPSAEAMLPEGETFDAVLEQVAAAAQFDEVLHLTGNDFIADAAVASMARLTMSPVVEIEGNREMTEAYLFGGVVQNPKTGQLEAHEGIVFQAQRAGGTLVVKNASTLPAEVLTRLTEIAATGHLQRVKDGKLEVQPRSFRLVLRSSEGDPPLARELGALCRVVRAPEITSAEDLRATASHQLRRVPGTTPLADALVDFHMFAAQRLEEESQLGRQELRFDSARLVEATKDLARLVTEEEWPLERALADVITRLYLRPSEGLDLEEALAQRFETFVEGLGGYLELEKVAPIDLVENPEVDALRRDYGKVAGALTGELLRAGADVLEVALDKRTGKKAEAALRALVDSSLLPAKLADRANRLLGNLPWGRLDEASAAEVQKLAKALVREAGGEEEFSESVLGFVRGARVWDLEYRLEIVDRYDSLFLALADSGGGLAAQRLAELDGVRERFDAAGAEARLDEARRAVKGAVAAYEQRRGDEDPQIWNLFRRVLGTWDLVSSSPIFRAHALPELHELERALVSLEEAYEARGEPVIELTALSDAMRLASRALEGVRIAEQSADLRRGIERSNQSTEQIVGSLKEEVEEIRRLEDAKRISSHLDAVERTIRSAGEEGLFLRLDPSAEKIERPAKRSDKEIQTEAKQRAEQGVALASQRRHAELMAEVERAAVKNAAPPPDRFFAGYDLSLDPQPARPAPNAADRTYEVGVVRIDEIDARELAARTAAIAGQLEKDDDARVERVFRTRLEQRVQEVGARVNRSANELRGDLQQVVRALDLPADLDAEARATLELLDEAIASTRGWMTATVNAAANIAGGMMRAAAKLFTFGFADLPAAKPEHRGPDLDDAKRAATSLLRKLHAHVTAERKKLPDFGKLGGHVDSAGTLVDRLLAAEHLGELATKLTKLEALRGHEDNADLRRHLGAVLGQIGAERGMRDMLVQVASFCDGADMLSAEAARGGVAVEMAAAVDAVMRAAEAVRTQSLGAGAYKNTVKALARAVERIDEMAEAGPLPGVLAVVRKEMEALSARIHEMFAGKRELLSVDGGSYREMLRSLSGSDGGAAEDAADAVAAALMPVAQLRSPDLNARLAPQARALAECAEVVAEAKSADEARERPERAARLTVIEVSFDRAGEIELPKVAAKKGADEEEVAARDVDRALRERVLGGARELENQAADRSGRITESRDRLLEQLAALEERGAGAALTSWSEALDGLRERLDVLAASADGVRGFTRELGATLNELRRVKSGLAGLEQVPDAQVVKLDAAIEGARALAGAFASDRFLHLARDWAAGALVTVTEVRGEIAERAAEVKGRDAPAGDVWAALQRTVDGLAAPVGRLGAWSRLSLLLHARQRLDALQGAVDPERLEKLLEATARGAQTHAQTADGPEREQAAADVLEAAVEVGAALVDRKKLGDEEVSTYEALLAQVAKVLEPLPEQREADRAAISKAIELAEVIAKGRDAGARAARELSLSLGHLRSGENARTIFGARTELRQEAELHLGRTRDARLVLDEASRAFVDYDPLTAKGTLQEIGRALRVAITDASEVLQGPACVVLAQTMIELAHRLETVADRNDPAAPEARRLLEELEPVLRRARFAAESADAPERYTAMVRAFEARTAPERTASDENASWAERAVRALSDLMRAEDAALPASLAAVEAEFFPALKKAEVAPAAEAEPQAARPAGGLANMLRVDVDGARGRLGALAGGRHDKAPDPVSAEREAGVQADLAAEKVDAPKKKSALSDIHRDALSDGEVSARSDKADVVKLSADGLKDIRKRMQAAQLEAPDVVDEKEKLLTEFEQFISDNQQLVDTMASTLRQFPGLETVLVLDQSGSTRDHYGDSRIIDQERAAMALIVAAHMRSERNCAVVGFGGTVGDSQPVSRRGNFNTYVHKPMAEKLDAESADYAYRMAANAAGGTDLIEPMNVALGQFTQRANNKLLLVLTDAQLNGAADVRRYVDRLRDDGVGVAMLGFGDAQHVKQVAGEYGEHVKSFSDAIRHANDLFLRAVVANAGRFQGDVKAAADGVGVPEGQTPIEAAASEGPMEQALLLSRPVNVAGDPSEVFATRGPRRELSNLVDRGLYERAVKALDRRHVEVSKSPSYRQCLKEIRALRARHEREGTIESLAAGIEPTLPKTRGVEWEGKQLSGSSFDEQQLILYVAGLAQGVPVQRIFKRRKGSEETKATVVLALDESSSMGDSEKMRANLEALLAYGDALKAADPEIKIAVVGYGDKVRLHAGFEQDWNDELKAHLLHQAKGHYDATDDERAAAEATGLLGMMDAEVGMVLNFSDGQGMPGMEAAMKAANENGYAFLTVGVGADCIGVSRFGAHGLYARNLAQMAQKLAPSLAKSWELAGRLS